MTVTVRFVGGSGLSSSLIKFHTFSPWTHVEFYTPYGYLGARLSGGVAVRPYDYDAGGFDHEEFRSIELPPDVEEALWKWAFAQVGKPYDWQSIIGMIVRRDWRDESAWFCSEMVTAAFDAVGHPILRVHEDVYRITPRDVGLSMELVPCASPLTASPAAPRSTGPATAAPPPAASAH